MRAGLNHTRVELHIGLCTNSRLLVLPTNIRPWCKWWEVANALAYYDTATIDAVKSFIVQAPGGIQTLNLRFMSRVFCHCSGLKYSKCLIWTKIFQGSLSVFVPAVVNNDNAKKWNAQECIYTLIFREIKLQKIANIMCHIHTYKFFQN